MKSYIGIDPGKYGCLAWYAVAQGIEEISGIGDRLTLVDLKLHDIKINAFRKFTEMQMAMESVSRSVQMLIDIYGSPELAVVETPASRPGEGVVSSFTFGKNCGMIEGILYGLNIKVIQVVPSVWKPKLGLTRDKARSIAKAQELFKDCHVDGGLDKFVKPVRLADGRAEAACMAWWGAQMGAKLL